MDIHAIEIKQIATIWNGLIEMEVLTDQKRTRHCPSLHDRLWWRAREAEQDAMHVTGGTVSSIYCWCLHMTT